MVTMADDDQSECPLCMEPLDFDDLSFYPCPCEYQICRFCWTKILDEGNGLCPACRNAYNSEKPASFRPLTEEEIVRIRKSKKMKEQAKKQKVTDSKRCLNEVRVVQNNLVFVIGLPCRLADSEVLKGVEYFGKYGKVYKIALSRPAGTGNQSSFGAYVTFYKPDDAIRALLDLRTTEIDRRTLKASLGTTKYCSSYLKGHPCPKPECMYLHELGDPNASFTKEEMSAGKHTEYEERLIQQYVSQKKPKQNLRGGQSARGKKSTRPAKSNEAKGGAKSEPPKPPEEKPAQQQKQKQKQKEQQQQQQQSNSRDSSQGSNHAEAEPMWPPAAVPLACETAFGANGGASHVEADSLQFQSYQAESQNPIDTNGMSNDDLDFDPFSESQRGLSECLQIEQAAALNQSRSHPPPGFYCHSQQVHRTRAEPPPGLPPQTDIKELAQALRNLFPNANVSYGDGSSAYRESDLTGSSLFGHRFHSPIGQTSAAAPPGLWTDPAIVSSHRELDFHRQDCSGAHSEHNPLYGSGFDRHTQFSLHWPAFTPFTDDQSTQQSSHSTQSHTENSHYFRNL